MKEPGNINELAEEIADYCQDVLGEKVRAVVHYNPHKHIPVYTRGDIPEQLQMDEDMRTMFRTPLVQVNKTVWQISQVAPTLAEPDFATFSFGDVFIMLLPITAEEGIVVSLDWDGELPEDLISDCKAIAYGPD